MPPGFRIIYPINRKLNLQRLLFRDDGEASAIGPVEKRTISELQGKMRTKRPSRWNTPVLGILGLILFKFLNISESEAVVLTTVYSQSVDQAIMVSLLGAHTDGSTMVGTLQIENTSDTWIYIEQDVTSDPNLAPVSLRYSVYLLGPAGIKSLENFHFPQGSYLKLLATTPVGLDNSSPAKTGALEGAFVVDLLTRGLLSFSLPPDAFDESPFNAAAGVIDQVLDQLVSSIGGLAHLAVALKNRDASDVGKAMLEIASDSAQLEKLLTPLLKRYLTSEQVHTGLGRLGTLAELLDLPERVRLLTDLTARTFDAPPSTWSRLDVVAKTRFPTISMASPSSLTTLPLPQAQPLTITGTDFTPDTTFVFEIDGKTYSSRPARLHYVNTSTIRYDIVVGGAAGTWTVMLADGGTGSATFQVTDRTTGVSIVTPRSGPHGSILPNMPLEKEDGESQTFLAAPQDPIYSVDTWYLDGVPIPNAGNYYTLADIHLSHTVFVTFRPVPVVQQTGAVQVNIAPQAAISAGGQWRVDAGNFRVAGDTVSDLDVGEHKIFFKDISGYITPMEQNVTILSDQLHSPITGTYIEKSVPNFHLILPQNNAQGVVAPFPSDGGNGYPSGSAVQLRVTPKYGYHFVGWGGDAVANGTANPITVFMDSDKTVTARFESGDPNLGTVVVTILPREAADAGVTWGFNASDFRASGSSYTTFPSPKQILTLHSVDGWLGPAVLEAAIIAGQPTPYFVPFTPDATPGFLTVTISPPGAFGAGRWHVKGVAGQGDGGDGTSLPLPPGANYVVTFDPIPGWTTPVSQTVTIKRAETKLVSGTYTPPAGLPLMSLVRPSVGPLAGSGFLTIEGVNFLEPASVFVGGIRATNVVVVSSSEITCSVPPNSVYGTQPVVVQTPGGSATNLNGFSYGFPRGNGIELVSSRGGSAFGIDVKGSYAYVGEGGSFLVLNISNPKSPSIVGRLAMPGKVMGIKVFDQYAFVADYDAGLQVVDISDAASPALKGFYKTLGNANAVAILGGRAYVAENNTFEVFDLSRPTYPELLSSLPVNGYDLAVQVTASGLFAYIVAGNSLSILDVSEATSPRLRGSLGVSPSYAAYSLAVSGNYAFIPAVTDGLKVIDISNPDSPTFLVRDSSIFPTAVAAVNNLIYATAGSGGFNAYSFVGKALTKIGQNALITAPAYGLVVRGTEAYVAAEGSGLQVVDVSDSSRPSPIAAFTDSGIFGDYEACAASGNYLYTLGLGGFRVFNVSNPAVPLIIAKNTGIANTTGQILLNGDVAYVPNGTESSVIDVRNPSAPVIAGKMPGTLFLATKMAMARNTLVIVGQVQQGLASPPGLRVYDISTPLTPALKGHLDYASLSGLARSVAVNGTTAVMGMMVGGPTGPLKTIDISDVSNPVERGSIPDIGSPADIQITDDGHYAYVADRNTNLIVVDISDVATPKIVKKLPTALPPYRLYLKGTLLYAAMADNQGPGSGVYVFDITNPTDPMLVKSYVTTGQNFDIAVSGDLVSRLDTIYVANGDSGLLVLKTQDTDPPHIIITNPTLSPIFTTNVSLLNVGGSFSDNVGVTRVTWSNSRGGGGSASVADSWYVKDITLFPGTNILTVTAFDAAGKSSNATLTVIYQSPNQSQTINFPAIADHTFGDAPIPLVAAASSGLPITFNVTSGPASLSNNVLTLNGAGTVIVRASRSGDIGFDAAIPKDISFSVAKAEQSITFPLLADKSLRDPPFSVDAAASSGLPVILSIISGPASVSGNVITSTNTGTVIVRASQSGNTNFNAALDSDRSFSVAKLPQFISFPALGHQVFGDAPFPLVASASSGLPIRCQIFAGPGVLSDSILTVTGPGLVTIRASQSGNDRYSAAPTTEQILIVAPDNNVIGEVQRQNGSFAFRFYAEPGRVAVIENSSDLKMWTTLSTNNVSSAGTVEFLGPADQLKMFYRVKIP